VKYVVHNRLICNPFLSASHSPHHAPRKMSCFSMIEEFSLGKSIDSKKAKKVPKKFINTRCVKKDELVKRTVTKVFVAVKNVEKNMSKTFSLSNCTSGDSLITEDYFDDTYFDDSESYREDLYYDDLLCNGHCADCYCHNSVCRCWDSDLYWD